MHPDGEGEGCAGAQESGGVDISRRHRLVTLWISTVSVCIRPGQQTG
ncbi:hypothetical protein BLAT2472_60359 [Burkholderia latens]